MEHPLLAEIPKKQESNTRRFTIPVPKSLEERLNSQKDRLAKHHYKFHDFARSRLRRLADELDEFLDQLENR